MIWKIPLLSLPLIIYNLVAFDIVGDKANGWSSPVMSLDMVSGAIWTLSVGDLLVVLALILLFVEVLKSTKVGNSSIMDHMLSTFVFIAYLVEFLLVPAAATSLFFTCMVMSLVDLMAGFSVSIRSASRDVNFGGH
ncbi:hypothetical protein [Maritalea sp.]|jgi:hypothetical protein|uniref:hypothetical protein n=1 Tax=Maritalea sp. TaxID=2003361 RepID=UPI0039E4657F